MRTFVKLKPQGVAADHARKMSDAYYQHQLQTWNTFRMFGLFASFAAMSLTVISVCNRHWLEGRGFNVGIWDTCIYNMTGSRTVATCPPVKSNWQNAVTGLLLFAVVFGFLATVLSVCGMCTTTLPKKIYYYHSAGEIYFICALSTTAALMVYPVAIETEKKMAEHQYGVGYGLGWGASFFFFAAAMCMCLDDLVRTIARGLCCGRKDSRHSRV